MAAIKSFIMMKSIFNDQLKVLKEKNIQFIKSDFNKNLGKNQIINKSQGRNGAFIFWHWEKPK